MTDNSPPIAWSGEAEEILQKVPGFVRSMAKEMIESYAAEKGASEITPELVAEARAKLGM